MTTINEKYGSVGSSYPSRSVTLFKSFTLVDGLKGVRVTLVTTVTFKLKVCDFRRWRYIR